MKVKASCFDVIKAMEIENNRHQKLITELDNQRVELLNEIKEIEDSLIGQQYA